MQKKRERLKYLSSPFSARVQTRCRSSDRQTDWQRSRSNRPRMYKLNRNTPSDLTIYCSLACLAHLAHRYGHLICTKMSSKLYFLKLLKRSGLSIENLHYFYIAVIRPISEYACTVWNHNLTATLCCCHTRRHCARQ